MKPNCSRSVVWPHHVRAVSGWAAATALSVAAALGATSTADGSTQGFPPLPPAGCCPVVKPQMVDLKSSVLRVEFCEPEPNFVAKPNDDLTTLDVRSRALPASRLRLEIAGLDLLNRESAKYPLPAPGSRFNPTRGDFPANDRVVDHLRWEWASATWKF